MNAAWLADPAIASNDHVPTWHSSLGTRVYLSSMLQFLGAGIEYLLHAPFFFFSVWGPLILTKGGAEALAAISKPLSAATAQSRAELTRHIPFFGVHLMLFLLCAQGGNGNHHVDQPRDWWSPRRFDKILPRTRSMAQSNQCCILGKDGC